MTRCAGCGCHVYMKSFILLGHASSCCDAFAGENIALEVAFLEQIFAELLHRPSMPFQPTESSLAVDDTVKSVHTPLWKMRIPVPHHNQIMKLFELDLQCFEGDRQCHGQGPFV